MKEGQPATVRVDAVPDKEFPAHVVEISPLAKIDFSGWPFPRNFDVSVQLDQADLRVRPGMSATARVAVEKLPDCILIPPEATFQKFGKTVAYVLSGSSFQEREHPGGETRREPGGGGSGTEARRAGGAERPHGRAEAVTSESSADYADCRFRKQ